MTIIKELDLHPLEVKLKFYFYYYQLFGKSETLDVIDFAKCNLKILKEFKPSDN